MTNAGDAILFLDAPANHDRTAEGTTPLPLSFTGSAGEYFRIWIVNLFLAVITLGIYSAWAKVRSRQYLYRHTWLDGASFDYLADPLKILKGRIIAVTVLGSVVFAQQYSIALYLVGIAVVLLATPWVTVKALGFNARNSAWRNVRFSFHGTTGQAFLEYLKGLGIAVITLGIGASLLRWRVTRFAVVSHAFGKLPFRFRTTGSEYFAAHFMAGMVGGMMMPLFGLIGFFVGGIDTESRREVGLMVGFGAAYFVMFAFLKARLASLVWGGMDIGPHRLSATLTFWRVLWLQATNLVAIACTLGLAYPWAKLRYHRYLVSQITLHASGPLFTESVPSTNSGGATGDALGEIVGFDLGFG